VSGSASIIGPAVERSAAGASVAIDDPLRHESSRSLAKYCASVPHGGACDSEHENNDDDRHTRSDAGRAPSSVRLFEFPQPRPSRSTSMIVQTSRCRIP